MDNDLMSANEALMAMPLPKMLAGLGLAVADANKALAEVKGPDNTRMTISEATIELNIAIAVDSSKKIDVGGALKLQAFSVNASYARTFNFKEEASSKITMKLAVAPGGAPTA